jgi:hypothetical protein
MKYWLETHFDFLLRPSVVEYFTTYHRTIQWEGKLTGKPYYRNEKGTFIQGVSPYTRVRSKEDA